MQGGAHPGRKRRRIYIPYLVTEEIAKSTYFNNTNFKDIVDGLLGSPSPMSNISMAILKHEEVLETFALFGTRQVEIASSHTMGNYLGTVGFGQILS